MLCGPAQPGSCVRRLAIWHIGRVHSAVTTWVPPMVLAVRSHAWCDAVSVWHGRLKLPGCLMQAFLDTMKRRGVSFLEMLAMEMKVRASRCTALCMFVFCACTHNRRWVSPWSSTWWAAGVCPEALLRITMAAQLALVLFNRRTVKDNI